jgi:hypothetical protein
LVLRRSDADCSEMLRRTQISAGFPNLQIVNKAIRKAR